MSAEIILIIAGMAIVTYIPRMLPLVFFNARRIPSRLEGILNNVPYAALGALIFPAALTVHDNPAFGLTGIAVAFMIAFLGGSLVLVVLGSILVLTMLMPIF